MSSLHLEPDFAYASQHTHAGVDYRTWLIIVLLFSSVFIGKAYAFVAMALGLVFVFDGRMLWRRWYLSLAQRGDPASSFSWALLVSLLYGILEVVRGYFLDYPLTTAFQILIFNICPIYFFPGLWAGARAPWIVPRFVRFTAWFTVVYTVLYLLVLRNLTISLSGILPGSNMELLGSPGSGSVTLLGLLACEPSLGRFWLPIIVLLCVTIANQERADWLGLLAALTIWGFLAHKIKRVVMIVGTLAVILLVASLVDLRLPAIPGRGGEISARDTIARMAGSVSPDMAEEAGASVSNSHFYYGTVYWRKHWWAQIQDEVSASSETLFFGLSYGYPLASLAGHEVEVTGTRSPHSIFYFVLGYSGIVGIVIFFWLQLSLFQLLWRSFKLTGETYGLIYFCYELIGAFFGNFLETPQGGIYVYIFLGLVCGPTLSHIGESSRSTYVVDDVPVISPPPSIHL